MPVDHNRYFVLTGGPGSGKTTLLAELSMRGHAVAPEAGRAVIRDQSAIDGQALPWRDRALFADLMLDRDIVSWQRADDATGPVFFDRGIVDTIGYLELEGLSVPAHMRAAAHHFRYAPIVFVAPFWPEIYANDAERRQDMNLARRTCEAVSAAWRDAGYRLVELPLAPVTARADFVLAAVRDTIAA